MHFEVVLLRQRLGNLTNRAGIERHGCPTLRADEVMPVHGRACDIDGPPRGIEDARQDAQ